MESKIIRGKEDKNRLDDKIRYIAYKILDMDMIS